MATKNPRQMVSLDKTLYEWIKRNAKQHDLSISMQIREYLKEFYELQEDKYWAKAGEKRLKSFNSKKAISHDEAWQ